MAIEVSTHSMLTKFRRCPRQAMYAYSDRLVPKAVSRPLKMGNWFHALLETHYRDGDWRARHQQLIEEHESKFFAEEVRDVPRSCERLMRSYLWYYQLEEKYGFRVLEAEKMYSTLWPDGSLYQCMIDSLVEYENDLWVMDHKLRSQLPGHLQRLLDSQSLLYLWCLRKNGIRVRGMIWNYVRMKPPAVPRVLKNGRELSRRKIETDYVTLRGVLRNNPDVDRELYEPHLARLRAVYWRPGKVQESPFFVREFMDKDDATINRMVLEMYRTRKRMARYDFTSNRDSVERVIGPDCKWGCSYSRLCATELFDGNTEAILRNDYEVGDPLAYYSRDGS